VHAFSELEFKKQLSIANYFAFFMFFEFKKLRTPSPYPLPKGEEKKSKA
jgi:hypothetical protein